MNIKYLLPTFFLLFTLTINAQKPSYKTLKLKYIQPPSEPLPKDTKTFYCHISNKIPEIVDINHFQLKEISNKKIPFAGFKRIEDEKNAHIQIKMSFFSGESKSKIIKTTKNVEKDGKKVEVPAEYISFKVKMKSDVFMRDALNNKKLLAEENLVLEKVYETMPSEALGLASKKLKSDGEKIIRELYDNLIYNRTKKFSDLINKKYGYPIYTHNFKITKGKSSKKYDYSDLENAYDSIKSIAALNQLHFYKDEKTQNTLNGCINVWKKAIEEYTPKTKKARINDKIVGGLYNNIAIANFMMKKWDNTYSFLEKGKEFKASEKRSKNIMKFIKNIQHLRSINPIYNENLK